MPMAASTVFFPRLSPRNSGSESHSPRLLHLVLDELEEIVLVVLLLGLGCGRCLEVLGNRVVELALVGRHPLDQLRRGLRAGDTLGAIVVGIEARQLHERVLLTLLLHLL